jgi:hypothetical protein
MKKSDIEKCEKMIREYNDTINNEERISIRNELFKAINPFMHQWVMSVLSKRGGYVSHEEIKSKSWDCFEYCLRHYKKGGKVPVPNHFYIYTRFHLTATSKPSEICECYDDNALDSVGDGLHSVYEHIDELKAFRSMLPNEYVSTFDDAVMSMVPDSKERSSRLDVTKLDYRRYREAKQLFKIVIEFLLMRQ